MPLYLKKETTMSSVVLTVKSSATQALLNQKLKLSGKPKTGTQAVVQFFKDLLSGQQVGILDVQTGSADPVAASGTFTLASVIATDAFTIGTETFVFSSNPANENQIEVDGADNTADAAAAAAAINAHSVIGKIVSATSALGVVTVTALQKGVVGNMIPISDADTTITTSGAFLTGGTGGVDSSATQYALGL
jgi:hypothetical protein